MSSVQISAHAYKTWAGETRVAVVMGGRSVLLDESESRALLSQLTAALATPPHCLDCGSEAHTVDSPMCPVATAGDDGSD